MKLRQNRKRIQRKTKQTEATKQKQTLGNTLMGKS